MSLRLLSWNCHHGALAARLSDVAELSPDIAFVHEWRPSPAAALPANVVVRQVKPSKGVALAAVTAGYTLAEIPRPRGAGRAVVAAGPPPSGHPPIILGVDHGQETHATYRHRWWWNYLNPIFLLDRLAGAISWRIASKTS